MEDAIQEAAKEKNPAPSAVAAAPQPVAAAAAAVPTASVKQSEWALRLGRMLAYTRNETAQILRDPVRLLFAFAGSALLMLVFGFGITTDVEHIRYAALDRDQSPESRQYLEEFAASKLYFTPTRPLFDD